MTFFRILSLIIVFNFSLCVLAQETSGKSGDKSDTPKSTCTKAEDGSFQCTGTPTEALAFLDEQHHVLAAMTRRLYEIRNQQFKRLAICEAVCHENKKKVLRSLYDREDKDFHDALNNEKEFVQKIVEYKIANNLGTDVEMKAMNELDASANQPPPVELMDARPSGPVVNIDDPFPPDLYSLEFNVFTAGSRIFGAPAGTVPMIIDPVYVDVGFGLTSRIELHAEIGVPTIYGGNNMPYVQHFDVWVAGLKILVYGNEKGFSAGLGPQYGDSGGSRYIYLPWLMSYGADKWDLTVNFGYQRRANGDASSNPNIFVVGAAYGIRIRPSTALLFEYIAQKPLDGEVTRTDNFGDVAVRTKCPHWFHLPEGSVCFANVGYGVNSDGRGYASAKGGVNFSVSNPFKKKKDGGTVEVPEASAPIATAPKR